MIRIIMAGAAQEHISFIRKYRSMLPEDFFPQQTGEASAFIITDDGMPIGFLSEYQLDMNTAQMNIWFADDVSFESRVSAVSCASERAVKLYMPEKIISVHAGEGNVKVMNACRFYRKGLIYQKKTEPLRRLIPNAAFDREGYLIHQGLTRKVPFGWFDSGRKGCGWIAAYNLLKINYMEHTMEECIRGLEKTSLLGEVMGQNEIALQYWLRKQGLNVRRSLPSDHLTKRIIKESRSGILLYTHKAGSHYAAYRVQEDGRIMLYNAIYGKTDHIADIDRFLENTSLFPLSSVLYVK